MRRFELSEGTSNKFWQVEREGASVTVCFGRIGTAGQTQVKTHASDAAAQSELDKLLKEKTKKGYQEIGGATAPSAIASPPAGSASAPSLAAKPASVSARKPAKPATPAPSVATPAPAHAPSPAPSPARSAPVRPTFAEGTIAWTDAALREAAPIRGVSTVPARQPDAAALYAKIARAFEGFGPRLDAGMKCSGAQKEAMKGARAAFAGPMPATLDLEAQAAAFALIGPKTTYGDESRCAAFVHLWFAKEGGAFAVRALAQAESLHAQTDDKSLALVSAPSDVPWFRRRDRFDWRALRLAAARSDDEAYAAMVQAAEACLAEGTPALRATLAVALEQPAWAEADVAASLASGQMADYLWPLILVAGSLDEARAQIARFQAPTSGHVWYLANAIDAVRYDLLARYGDRKSVV